MGRFDTVFKEIILNASKAIFEIILGVKIEMIEPITFELPKIERKIPVNSQSYRSLYTSGKKSSLCRTT